ncbi:MAG: hypothetical protein JNK85_27260 [Verrucomicrobiales bacterium]|nr:hypothetical protein [Verrucomicrobiales bacterium]
MVVREAQLAWGTPRYLKIIPPLESFLWWDSFSEVEQTKATLRAHALRAIAESRARYLQIRRRPALGVFSEDAIADRALSEEIDRLNRQIVEFGGTDQEIMLTGELLHVLQKAERNNEWLDVFLASAYRWPTHDLVEWNVRRATEMGRQTGREDEVSNAIRYREGIPTKYRETQSTEEVANTRATEPRGSPSPRSQRPSRLHGAATGVGAP